MQNAELKSPVFAALLCELIRRMQQEFYSTYLRLFWLMTQSCGNWRLITWFSI